MALVLVGVRLAAELGEAKNDLDNSGRYRGGQRYPAKEVHYAVEGEGTDVVEVRIKSVISYRRTYNGT